MKKLVIIVIGVIVVGVLAYFTVKEDDLESSDLFTEVKFGDFVIDVVTSGELEAKSSVKIYGPGGMRTVGIWQATIDDIVPEGTLVEKGDYIASLNKSELLDKINQANNDKQEILSKYTQVKMDTALELRKVRDELVNLEFAVEEKKIVVDQSKFEPEAQQQQFRIDLQKAELKLKQAQENYLLQKRKSIAQMSEVAAKLSSSNQKLENLMKVLDEFTIKAPEAGMLIYKRNWRGQKQGVGTQIHSFDPVVATLPDLKRMISKTYVNEVDIRVIKVGQDVKMGLDAFPEKKLTGKVTEVANIGEQKPNSDSKVFSVLIEVSEEDTTLLPSMTTSNRIIAETIPEVLSVPLEAVHSQGDTISYVYMMMGGSLVKQEVDLGESNSNEVIIVEGVEEGDKLYLSIPSQSEKAKLIGLLN